MLCRGGAPKYGEDGEYIALNQRCIRNHRIDFENARHVEAPKSLEKSLAFGDILICSTGVGTLGRAAQVLFRPSLTTVDSHVTIIRPKTPELIEYLGCWALLSEAQFEAMAKGSTGQTELPRIELEQLEIVVPDGAVLRDFSTTIAPIFEALRETMDENRRLAQLRDTLLPKLMSGEIDISQVNLTKLNGHL